MDNATFDGQRRVSLTQQNKTTIYEINVLVAPLHTHTHTHTHTLAGIEFGSWIPNSHFIWQLTAKLPTMQYY